jgi:hypothetical protein
MSNYKILSIKKCIKLAQVGLKDSGSQNFSFLAFIGTELVSRKTTDEKNIALHKKLKKMKINDFFFNFLDTKPTLPSSLFPLIFNYEAISEKRLKVKSRLK